MSANFAEGILATDLVVRFSSLNILNNKISETLCPPLKGKTVLDTGSSKMLLESIQHHGQRPGPLIVHTHLVSFSRRGLERTGSVSGFAGWSSGCTWTI